MTEIINNTEIENASEIIQELNLWDKKLMLTATHLNTHLFYIINIRHF